MKLGEKKWFVVYCCGCTDCFVHAAFLDRQQAVDWGIENCKCTEGHLIKEMTLAELAEERDD